MAGASTYQRIDKIQIQENKKVILKARTRTCLVEADVANNKAHLGAILRGNVPGTTSTRVFCVLGKHKYLISFLFLPCEFEEKDN